MKKPSVIAVLLLSMYCAVAQPGTSGGDIKMIPGGSVKIREAMRVKNSAIIKKMLASLPSKSFDLGGRKGTVTLVSVDKLKGIVSKPRSQKMTPKGRNDRGDAICQQYQVSVSAESEDFDVPYANAASYIYPGAVYLYSDYYSNSVSPRALTWARNPVYIQAASYSADGQYELVANPTSINLEKAIGTIKRSLNPNATNASTSIKMISVFDEADFRFKVNAGGGGMGARVDASFGISNNSRKSYFLIDVKQTFFTLKALLPESDTATVFKSLAHNQNQEALLMSTVNYGRRVLGVVETEFESEEMAASFQARYTAGFAGGYAGLDMLNGMKREKTTVKLYFVGGRADAITVPNPTAASVQNAVNNYLRNTTTQNAVPVSFSFRNMAMSPMRYESATEKFTYEQCTPKKPEQRYNVKVELIAVQNETDKMEKVKFGLAQFASLYVNNKLKEPGVAAETLLKPLVAWGVPRTVSLNLYPTEEAKIFSGNKQVNKVKTYQLTQKEIVEGNAYIELKTTYIAMYATRIAGGDDTKVLNKSIKVYLKDVMNSVSRPIVDISFNARSFLLSFMVQADATQ